MILTSDLMAGLTMGALAGALAALVYALLAWRGRQMSHRSRILAWTLAWWLHGVAIATSLFTTPATFGFGPALSATAWLVMCVYAIEARALPKLQSHPGILGWAALAVLIGWVFPGKALAPTTSFWQPVHWGLGLASYGLLAAAVIHGALMSVAERRIRQGQDSPSGLPVLTLERLTFHLLSLGFVLLTLTLVLAVAQADVLYGAAGAQWRWDHKTVLSLLSWLVFAVLLAGRYFLGWRGPKAVRFLYVGSALLFLAYVGSHFVKEVLLGRG